MLKLLTMVIILSGCQTTMEERVKKCPRTVFYNQSKLFIEFEDMKFAEQASIGCKLRNPKMPCALWIDKRGEINYHIQCGLMPRYDSLDPIYINPKFGGTRL